MILEEREDDEEEETKTTENDQIVSKPQLKATKSIIKPPQSSSANTDNQAQTTDSSNENNNKNNNRRVNFDPHALLLDAAVEGELDLVIRCAKQVKNISEPNDEGITALHNSVCAGHFDIVKFLIEYGCDVNYADNDGWTPLHCAASCNNIQMIRFLVESGASVFATTLSDNETPIRKCEEDEDGFRECYDYLYMIEKQLGDKQISNSLVHALYNYAKQNEDELSFEVGDRLIVLDKHESDNRNEHQNPEEESEYDDEEMDGDGWWTCKLLDKNVQEVNFDELLKENDEQNVGLVPKNYLAVSAKNFL